MVSKTQAKSDFNNLSIRKLRLVITKINLQSPPDKVILIDHARHTIEYSPKNVKIEITIEKLIWILRAIVNETLNKKVK